MKFLDKMYTFLILWLLAHIQTTDHEMSAEGEGGEIDCVFMVQCGMNAGYIATSHLLLAGRQTFLSFTQETSSMSQTATAL